MPSRFVLCALALALCASGCAMRGEPAAVYARPDAPLCLADNPGSDPRAFLAIRRALIDKGYEVRNVRAKAVPADCAQTVFYEARIGTSWDPSALKSARLTVTENDPPFGKSYTVEISHPAAKPSLLDDTQEVETELRRLVDRLLPDRNPWEL